METFYKRAIEKVDSQAALACVKIMERKAALLGLDQPTKLDVIQVQAQKAPTSYERITEVLMNLKYGPNGRPAGRPDSDGAVDTLSGSDDTEQKH